MLKILKIFKGAKKRTTKMTEEEAAFIITVWAK